MAEPWDIVHVEEGDGDALPYDGCQPLLHEVFVMARSAITKTLSLTPEEAPRFDRLVRRFGHGSPTEWVRVAMDRMETAEIAEELSELRSYGQQRAKAKGVADSDVHEAVRRTLNR